ncbi:MAG: hypothetical protein E2P02_14255 [Acidobacteria bacterium]|nr:MAG: hypothetical protein E2P02_14255 [Acidobacteriota bacterium]
MEARTLVQSAFRYWIYVRVAPGAVDAERAVELMRLAGDLWGLADALMWAQIHSFFGGRRKDAESLHDELESLSNQLGHVFAAWGSGSNQLYHKILDGDLTGLASFGRETLDWTRALGFPLGAGQTLGLLSLGELWVVAVTRHSSWRINR